MTAFYLKTIHVIEKSCRIVVKMYICRQKSEHVFQKPGRRSSPREYCALLRRTRLPGGSLKYVLP